jgi:capsular polysaccharide export protein
MLQDGGWESPALRARAEAGVALMRRQRLTKYALTRPSGPQTTALLEMPYTLVIDQRRGDMSIALGAGAADPEAADALFRAMLGAAKAERPHARPVVKVHPDALTGRHAGHLVEPARAAGAALVAEPIDPWALTENAEAVYTVSSLLGFEALMAGRPVRCFGCPFYAGWGVTQDERPHPRRTRRRDVVDIFAAAYLLYARYVDPATGAPADFESAAAALAARRDARNAAQDAGTPRATTPVT